ncbi:MAG: flagellar basal-body MS-ring/collar protein FliF [Candidatus Thiodiazotropha sp. 6PLUC2]
MLKETWHNSGLGSRSGLIGGAMLILILTFTASWWLLQNRSAVLFTDLEPNDAAAVVTELERIKVSYKLTGDGTRIMVPEDEVHEIRLKLLGNGLPLNGGVGFEVFDNAEFGMTEFAQRINFQRAMQGELTRTITSLKEVKYARVHLVMPEASLFKESKTPPSASITMFLKPGAQLNQQQIEGIQRLVSSSVQGLDSTGVTIIDQYGKTLSALINDETVSSSVSSRLEKKQEVETYLTEKVARVLERTFGPGQAIVSIDVTLNYDQSKTTREEVIPGSEGNTGIVRKRESHSNSSSRKGKGKGDGEINSEIEYRLGHSVEQIVSTPGGIERLSVGVLVPTSAAEEQIKQIEDLVAMAVGLDLKRGDAIAVHAAASGILPGEKPDLLFEPQLSNTASNPALNNLTPDVTQEFNQINGETSPVLGQISKQKDTTPKLPDWLVNLWAKLVEKPMLVAIVLFLLLMVLTGVMMMSRRKHEINETRMIAAERERVLGQLKTWLSTDDLNQRNEGEAT